VPIAVIEILSFTVEYFLFYKFYSIVIVKKVADCSRKQNVGGKANMRQEKKTD
jgi:hypothetical protein